MGIAALDYRKSGTGLNINGIIQDYYVYAGENISAGDFVEFVNGVASSTTETVTITSSDTPLGGCGRVLSACKLSNDKIFIVHGSTTSESSSNYIYGVVCSLSTDGTISPGTDTLISTNAYSGWSMSVCALSDTKVFIAYRRGSTKYLNAQVCTISGTTVTLGTDTKIAEASTYCSNAISVEMLSSTSVCVVFSSGSNNYIGTQICTISGATITEGDKYFSSDAGTNGGYFLSTAKLSSSKVFVTHGNPTNTSGTLPETGLYGVVVSITGTTVTYGSDVQILSDQYSGVETSTVARTSTSVFIAHTYGSNRHLYGVVCTVSGTTITVGTDTSIQATTNAGYRITANDIGDGVFIAYSYSSSFHLYGQICTISGTTITTGKNTSLSGTHYAGFVLESEVVTLNGESKIFIAHTDDSSYNLSGQLFSINKTKNIPTNEFLTTGTITTYETQVRPATTLPCNGVAKTSGIGGSNTAHNQQVSVYVPDV